MKEWRLMSEIEKKKFTAWTVVFSRWSDGTKCPCICFAFPLFIEGHDLRTYQFVLTAICHCSLLFHVSDFEEDERMFPHGLCATTACRASYLSSACNGHSRHSPAHSKALPRLRLACHNTAALDPYRRRISNKASVHVIPSLYITG